MKARNGTRLHHESCFYEKDVNYANGYCYSKKHEGVCANSDQLLAEIGALELLSQPTVTIRKLLKAFRF